MKKIEFLTFNDGYATINDIRYPYGERSIGYRRHYAAKTAGSQIDTLIHIPYTKAVKADDKVTIGDVTYRVELAQELRNTNPHCVLLTLRRYSIKR